MPVRYSTATLTAMLGESGVDAGADGIKGLFKDGVINIYSGNQPASADNADGSGVLLGVVTLNSGAFVDGQAANGLEFDPPVLGVLSKIVADIWSFNAIATGTAGWFRLRGNAADNGAISTTLPRIDGTIGLGTGDMALPNTDLVIGAPNAITQFSIKLTSP
jgi:hypothetical protein